MCAQERLRERRARLDELLQALPDTFEASPLLRGYEWSELQALRATSRERCVEGMMLKHSESTYTAGRQRGTWWKWKIDPYTFDGVPDLRRTWAAAGARICSPTTRLLCARARPSCRLPKRIPD
jgi:hypothetical protein